VTSNFLIGLVLLCAALAAYAYALVLGVDAMSMKIRRRGTRSDFWIKLGIALAVTCTVPALFFAGFIFLLATP